MREYRGWRLRPGSAGVLLSSWEDIGGGVGGDTV